MEQSIGRDTEPTTRPDAPDARQPDDAEPTGASAHSPEVDADIQRRLRDLPPSRYRDDTGITDLDELQRHIDPLDPRRPRRLTDDPLDPERDAR
ncbi:hypothetical protein J2X63_001151 [Agromyces sp. 3263]|uniref:hypothetical protein n=1 Tax=Agromyces sp. 3263 TaxID=2817750 RepID=UPI0028616B9F|nr:hypothetical protein [Agromyces sp. 3263]MDR6905465.1 hypothetical protein [Agromyces sp. 3263]